MELLATGGALPTIPPENVVGGGPAGVVVQHTAGLAGVGDTQASNGPGSSTRAAWGDGTPASPRDGVSAGWYGIDRDAHYNEEHQSVTLPYESLS